jgi:D-amino-acid oxidase
MSLPALPSRGLVVNCTGLSAHALATDPTVTPSRGQVVLLEDPGLTEWLVDERERDGLIGYVLPHGRHVVVGGTLVDGDWSTAVRPPVAEAIVRRAVRMVPALGRSRVLGHRVGLRPLRPTVRMETERSLDRDGEPRTVVHCYGHGGSGITLAWGCAADVLDAVLVEDPVHA